MADEIVYQYTTHEAAYSMIRNAQLWLTSIFHLNDAREYLWLFEQFRKYVLQRAANKDPVDSRVVEHVERRERQLIRSGTSVSVSCFSSRPDDASQWERYGSRGGGVALGFRTQSLRDAITRNPPLGAWGMAGEVSYGEASCAARLDAATRELEQALRDGRNLFGSRKDPLEGMAAFAKDRTHESEQEFRVCAAGTGGLEYLFRFSSDGLIPYVSIPFSRDGIVEVRVGPRSRRESLAAWELALAQIYRGRPHHIQVSRSESALR